MRVAYSKLTSQGQISVPVEVRRRLDIAPGSLLEWEAKGGEIVVRRAGLHTSEDVHRTLFAARPKRRTLKELKEGIRTYIQDHHARR
ncbi:MAG: AbrB/MazE/SpoVT family DNA-binding domain-containing protein [Acidobacteria bacterium]|nr:AbrB/MazE/SpoVT family DNA-binding domain-containing protein [Acidobacteriota bacterium]